jgi:hypothetical protein
VPPPPVRCVRQRAARRQRASIPQRSQRCGPGAFVFLKCARRIRTIHRVGRFDFRLGPTSLLSPKYRCSAADRPEKHVGEGCHSAEEGPSDHQQQENNHGPEPPDPHLDKIVLAFLVHPSAPECQRAGVFHAASTSSPTCGRARRFTPRLQPRERPNHDRGLCRARKRVELARCMY